MSNASKVVQMQKKNKDMPDYFGMTFVRLDGVEENYKVTEYKYNEKMQTFEFFTTEDILVIKYIPNFYEIKYDKENRDYTEDNT